MQYDLNKQLFEMNKMGNTIQSMIEPFLNNTNDDKKRIELWHLGKFIYNFDTSIEIQSVGEEPDFIIKKGELLIGLEVTRYFKEEIKNINSIEQLIKKSEKIFNTKYPDKKYYVNLNLKEQIIYNKHESNIIAENIADYINNFICGIVSDKIDFIEHIQVIPHNHESFFQIRSAYAVPPLTKENVEPYIIKKEKNIKKYIANTNSNLQWLLIVVSGANEASDYFYISDDVYSITSSFNNIFILKDFKAEVTQIL